MSGQHDRIGVLFVCLGNICRSPLAEAVFRSAARDAGLADRFDVDSAGTSSYHTGEGPDVRTVAVAHARGIQLDHLARQIHETDFARFDYVLVMDRENLRNLQRMCPPDFRGELQLFLHYSAHPDQGEKVSEVPDPYHGDTADFARVVDLVETAAQGLLRHIVAQHRLT